MVGRYSRSPFRIGTTDCKVDEPFRYNNGFTLITGADWFIDGQLRFPHDPTYCDGTFRTVFGPSVPHNGRIYGATNENVALAIRRLTSVRCPDKPGVHEELCEAQCKFVQDPSTILFLEKIKQKWFLPLSTLTSVIDECIMHHADPHPKLRLRLQAFADLQSLGWLGDPDHIWLRKVIWKMKREEWAKFGKKPRMIADLATPASLLGFRHMELLKQAMASEVIEVGDGIAEFIKTPDPRVLERVFRELHSPSKRFYFCFFSDDACFAVHHQGKVLRFNLDISSCDASHTRALFDVLVALFPSRLQKDIRRLVRQCMAPLCLRATQDRTMRVKLKPKNPILMSGSVLTTAINNLANLLICFALSKLRDFTPEDIERAAASVGYIVTGTKPLEQFEDLQFLKHSPVYDLSGEIRPLLNLGVLLRASGTCHGDLPGRGPMQPRAEAFQKALLRGMYPHASFTLLDNMKATVQHASEIDLDLATAASIARKVVSTPGYSTVYPDPVSLYRRYRLDAAEQSSLENDFGHAGYTHCYNHSAANKILQLDYGLSTVEYSENVNVSGCYTSYN